MENANTQTTFYEGLFSAIVPCKDEAEMIPIFYAEFIKAMGVMNAENFEIIFVDDGSTDSTFSEIEALCKVDNRVHCVSFSRNFGKEAAMYAGLKEAKGDYVAILDADLQDPPDLLPEMFKMLADCDCVATRRITREGEPPARTFFTRLFYKTLNSMSQLQFKEGARDFRLMKRKVVDEVLRLDEYNRFTKGIFEWVGFKTKWLEFENRQRPAGQTKWSMGGLFLYSLEAFTSFSTIPLAIASILGIGFCFFSVIAIIFITIRELMFHNSAFGWPSMVCILFFLSGLQLFCLGVLGQYMAKIYLESKKRPHYIISKTR